jgi:hypothetical protein
MQPKSLLAAACLALLALSIRTLAAQDEVGDLLGRINNLRGSKGLASYSLNGALSAAAQSQAQWMIDNACAIMHIHPDGSSPRTRAASFGYPSSDVSENIYCGTSASTDAAWVFWINSAIHYRGLTNERYQEIGIASGHSADFQSFVLVFGNPGGQSYVPPAAGNSAPQAPPSYVLGVDEHGNIMHEIQPGETLGDIALIYGYTWGDIPGMLTLNGLTQDDIRKLSPGAVFLVPPKAGTYTPTPGGEAQTAGVEAPTANPSAEAITSDMLFINTATPSPVSTIDTGIQPTPAPTQMVAATSNSMPQAVAMLLATAPFTPDPSATATVQTVADAAPTGGQVQTTNAGVVITRSGTSPWLAAALLVQVGVLLAAGVEFIRRKRKR